MKLGDGLLGRLRTFVGAGDPDVDHVHPRRRVDGDEVRAVGARHPLVRGRPLHREPGGIGSGEVHFGHRLRAGNPSVGGVARPSVALDATDMWRSGVRRARAWRVPALAAAGLLAASLAIFLAPLWTLGPGTAVETWARVMAAGTAGGLPALLAAGPAVASALAAVLAGEPGTRPALAGGLLASGGAFALLARQLARRPSRPVAARRG